MNERGEALGEEEELGVSLGLLLGKVAHSGSRPNPKAVVSAIPTIAKIMSIIAVPFINYLEIATTGQDFRDCHHVLELFRKRKGHQLGGPSRGRKPRPPSQGRGS